MTDRISNAAALNWYLAYEHWQTLKDQVEAMDASTPGEEMDAAECELEVASFLLMGLDAPTIEAIALRIELFWGGDLNREDDPDTAGRRAILRNLRMLSNELDKRDHA